jgi:hypothetical protein
MLGIRLFKAVRTKANAHCSSAEEQAAHETCPYRGFIMTEHEA